jgi:tryptophan synthase alpha chain
MASMTNRIQQTFDDLKTKGQKALIPYIMAGDPSLNVTESLVLTLAEGGADLIELGVPFSDPIADGPVIQQAAERALQSGTTLKKIFALVISVRKKTHVPIIFMAYFNTILAMGLENFCAKAAEAGVDGLIVPDLPPEESDELYNATKSAGGPIVIFLLAPTSTSNRCKEVIKRTHGFIYYVSLTGITGSEIPDLNQVKTKVQTIQKMTQKPIAVGFGIATPEQAQNVAQFADGVIIGSALVRNIAEHHQDPAFLTNLKTLTTNLKTAIS